jgi:hypothetical protein
MDDDQENFIPKLAIDNEFFVIAHLPNLVRCIVKPKAQSEQCAPYNAIGN